MSKLHAVLAAATDAREAYQAQCLVVWKELQIVEPELAVEILAFGFDEATAAKWVCRPNRNGDSPAALVIAGRTEDVRSAIQRAVHGFVG